MTASVDWTALARAARTASGRAYCPYSRFAVGAAVLGDDGRVFTGCNVENASFGLTVCAERNAIFHAIAEGARRIVALALYTPTAEPATPCGACRQVLVEFGPDADVECRCDGRDVRRFTVSELLPHGFQLEGSG